MIGRGEIDSMAEKLGVHAAAIQRDYVHGWLLALLYSSSSLADRVVLKGGNCLRKGYFEHARYSRDLDFTTSTSISNEELGRELNAICRVVVDRAGVVFDMTRTRVENKRRADADKSISEARLYFRDFYGKENEIVLGVRLDVTQFDRTYLPIQSRSLIYPYSDSDICKANVQCVKLEEILASKMRCLLQRRHIADLFDLVYGVLITREIEINRSELLSTFFKITIFKSAPRIAKGLLIDLPLETLGAFWTKYISCPRESWFSFEKAKESLFSFIEMLIPEPAIRDYSPTFFPSSLRNPIMEAAESLTMLILRYDGVNRLVEPYELSFKIRRDGMAREYLYAYDTTGGGSSGPGLKTFLPEKVEALENTDRKFDPRFDVELRKAGGAEAMGYFEGRHGPRRGILTVRRIGLRRLRGRRHGDYSAYGLEYVIECLYCGRHFKRKAMNMKLNPHKDNYGNPCFGRMGFLR
jgi:predicted nucleotidyltransferase component of viral defense system